jgi:hypothetical protein
VFLEKKNQVKLIKNRLFTNSKGDIIRIVSTVKRANIVNVYNYTSFTEESMEYDTAAFFLSPVFRIGEVARIIDKKSDTIRKYETSGLIPKARKVNLNKEGTSSIRVYTLRDVYDLVEIFSMRNKAGRKTSHVPVNQTEALRRINARFQKIKNVGS